MKNDNDLILERLRGIPKEAMRECSLQEKFDPRNPNRLNANDNEPKRQEPCR